MPTSERHVDGIASAQPKATSKVPRIVYEIVGHRNEDESRLGTHGCHESCDQFGVINTTCDAGCDLDEQQCRLDESSIRR